jgi:hypothetical protein
VYIPPGQQCPIAPTSHPNTSTNRRYPPDLPFSYRRIFYMSHSDDGGSGALKAPAFVIGIAVLIVVVLYVTQRCGPNLFGQETISRNHFRVQTTLQRSGQTQERSPECATFGSSRGFHYVLSQGLGRRGWDPVKVKGRTRRGWGGQNSS